MRDDVIITLTNDQFKKIADTDVVKFESPYSWYSNSLIDRLRLPLRKMRSLLRKILSRLGLPTFEIWNKKLKGFKGTYIIFQTTYLGNVFSTWLRENNPESRIIYYLTNPIKEDNKWKLEIPLQNKCEIWTFYQEDTQKYTEYNIRYNPTFYLELNYEAALKERKEPEYDIFFIGLDKGRLDTILRLQEETKEQNLSWFLYVMADRRSETTKSKEYKKKRLRYEEAMKLQIKAKAVLEIIPEWSKAYSLRVWESLYLDQKLITNNKAVKQLDFYDKNNIFVLGEDDNTLSIREFLDLPYRPVPEEIKKKYSFEAWLNRFFEQ